ncbi:MAG: DUF4350 domain-containing protein [Candidatus Sericytochromatia bacterium]
MMLVKRTLALLAAATALTGCGFTGTPQPLFTARGVVTDTAGKPVPGAVVSDGKVGVLTDENGRYAIGLFETQLRVRKPGFAGATIEASRETTAQVRLGAATQAPRVAIDTRWVGSRMDAFRDHLAEAGVPMKAYPATPLAQIDVLMLVTPGAFRAEELSAVRAWLRAGGRLILCGEWGGYPSQDLDLLNALASDAGITFTGATVKLTDAEPAGQEWLSIKGISPPSLGQLTGSEDLHLYTSTSLSLSAPAQPIFSTDRRSYSVLASRTGPQVVGAVGASALGKVFALGDSSLWLDEDSDGAGSPNWRRGANFRLAEALIRW